MPDHKLPYGDAYIIQTPHIDELAKQIYTEQRQKELYRQQQQKELDDNFSKELAGVKKVDIPDVVNAWGTYKQATIDNYRKGNKSTPQDRYKLLELRADVEQKIAGSKEDKERIKGYQTGIGADKKRLFDPNAATTATKYLNTPTSQRTPENDHDELMYKYAVPDLAKEKKVAKGDLKDVQVRLGQNKDDKFSDDVEVYSKVGNGPNDAYNAMYSQMAARSDHDNYSGLMHNKYSDDELEKLKTDYFAKVSDPKFIAVYGETKPFPESAGKTDLGQAVAIQTMEDVVNTPLKASKTIKVPNKEGIIANQQAFQKAQQDRTFEQQRRMARMQEGLRETYKTFASGVDAGERDQILNKFIELSGNTGTNKLNGRNVDHITIAGEQYKGKFIEVPKSIILDDAIKTGEIKDNKPVWRKPDRYYQTEDKQYVIPVFIEGKTQSGGNYLKTDIKPIPIHLWKERLAKDLLTKGKTGAEVVDDDLTNYVEDDEPKKRTESESHTSNKQFQTRTGKDGKKYTSQDGKTWTAEDGTTVILK